LHRPRDIAVAGDIALVHLDLYGTEAAQLFSQLFEQHTPTGEQHEPRALTGIRARKLCADTR
jgi:hypothetical protein